MCIRDSGGSAAMVSLFPRICRTSMMELYANSVLEGSFQTISLEKNLPRKYEKETLHYCRWIEILPPLASISTKQRKKETLRKCVLFNREISNRLCRFVCYGHQKNGCWSVDRDPNRPARGRLLIVKKIGDIGVEMKMYWRRYCHR